MRARTISRIMLGFLATFLLMCAAIVALHIFWVWPKERCEAKGGWWSPQDWKCAVPIELQRLTGRPNPGAAADSEVQSAFEQLPQRGPALDGPLTPPVPAPNQ